MFAIYGKTIADFFKNFFGFSRTAKKIIAIACTVCCLVTAYPSYSAEKIRFNYGLLDFKVELSDLEYFIETGSIPQRLNFYLRRIAPDKRETLRDFLKASYDVNPWLAYRFSRTSVGEKMLDRMGDFIQIPENINGFYGIRAAILKTVTAEDANNILNLLRNFPTDIKLNLGELLELIRDINNTEQASKDLVTALSKKNTVNNSQDNFQDLTSLGEYQVQKETFEFYDAERDRGLVSDLYLPQIQQRIPLVVVSNGLGAKRTRFAELANYLASYGFAVVVPEHPGSNYQRQREFIKGLHQENFAASDYIERPRDISFLLDRLSVVNEQEFNSLLDTNNVGIFGYSIGGTTALSLTGAKLDFERLQEHCDRTLDLTNISILYQCRALEIEPQTYDLEDSRIKAAYLFVPFGNSLFDPETVNDIDTPMLWQVVDKDFLTSLVSEQIPLYQNLGSSDRYLAVTENLPHSTAILSKERSLQQQDQSRIGRKYQNIISLVFFDRHLKSQPNYSSYLSQNYLQTIAEAQYRLYLTKDLPPTDE